MIRLMNGQEVSSLRSLQVDNVVWPDLENIQGEQIEVNDRDRSSQEVRRISSFRGSIFKFTLFITM